MTGKQLLANRVRAFRVSANMSQDELAQQAGISRAGISAIEMGRLVPSTTAALALASVFGCRVEDLFSLAATEARREWAWTPQASTCRYWLAEFTGRQIAYPLESTELGVIAHDGVFREGEFQDRPDNSELTTLVIASCDPAIGLLADQLRAVGVRLIALQRSSREALDLLGKGLVHAAGIHLARCGTGTGHSQIVRERIGDGFRLLHVARWEEGVATAGKLGLKSLRSMLQAKLRWVGREPGSAARLWLDQLFDGRRPPRRLASTHRQVANAIRSGWADAGVCHRLASEEAGLDFCSLDEEIYDLCFPDNLENHPAIRHLVDAVRSTDYRGLLDETPGVKSVHAGEIEGIG